MGRWGALLMMTLGSLAIGGCHSSSKAHTLRVPDHHAPGADFQSAFAADLGVLRINPSRAGLDRLRRDDSAASGWRIVLDSCELRAPGSWTVTGRAIVSGGERDIDALINFGISHGDVGESVWASRVTVTRSGTFALAVQASASDGRSRDARTPSDDVRAPCYMMVTSSSAPVEAEHNLSQVASTVAPGPIHYSAPSGTIQSLGLGARLDDPNDPRTISLYSAWGGVTTSIRTVYVPHLAGYQPAFALSLAGRPPCNEINMTIGPADGVHQFIVATLAHCDGPTDPHLNDTHLPVGGAAGFTWARGGINGPAEIAQRIVGTTTVWVEGGVGVSRAEIARVAGSLTTLRNAAIG